MRRYDLWRGADSTGNMQPSENGDWVRFADVEHLRITHANTIDTLQRSLKTFERANREVAMSRVPAEIKEAAAAARRNEDGVQAANALLTEEVDALKAEVEKWRSLHDALVPQATRLLESGSKAKSSRDRLAAENERIVAESKQAHARNDELVAERIRLQRARDEHDAEMEHHADALAADNARLRAALEKAHQYIHGNCTLRNAEAAIDEALAALIRVQDDNARLREALKRLEGAIGTGNVTIADVLAAREALVAK